MVLCSSKFISYNYDSLHTLHDHNQLPNPIEVTIISPDKFLLADEYYISSQHLLPITVALSLRVCHKTPFLLIHFQIQYLIPLGLPTKRGPQEEWLSGEIFPIQTMLQKASEGALQFLYPQEINKAYFLTRSV